MMLLISVILFFVVSVVIVGNIIGQIYDIVEFDVFSEIESCVCSVDWLKEMNKNCELWYVFCGVFLFVVKEI